MPMDDWNRGDFFVELDCDEDGDVVVRAGYETRDASCYDVDPDHAVSAETLFDYLFSDCSWMVESELERRLEWKADDEGYGVLDYCELKEGEDGEWRLVQTRWDKVYPDEDEEEEEEEEEEDEDGEEAGPTAVDLLVEKLDKIGFELGKHQEASSERVLEMPDEETDDANTDAADATDEPEPPKAPILRPCFDQEFLDRLVAEAIEDIRCGIECEDSLYESLHSDYLENSGSIDVGGLLDTVMFDGTYFTEETLNLTVPKEEVVAFFRDGRMAAALSHAGYCSDEYECAQGLFRGVLRMENEDLRRAIREQLKTVDREEFLQAYPEFEHLLPQA